MSTEIAQAVRAVVAGEASDTPEGIFVLMPFAQEFDVVYQSAIRRPIELIAKLGCRRADDIFAASGIVSVIAEALAKCSLVIADVTGRNPNVYYELGIAHSMGKKVIIVTQSRDDMPFDVQHIQNIKYSYSFDGIVDLGASLLEALDQLGASSPPPADGEGIAETPDDNEMSKMLKAIGNFAGNIELKEAENTWNEWLRYLTLVDRSSPGEVIRELDKFLESKLLEFKNREERSEKMRENRAGQRDKQAAGFLAGVGISAEFGFGAIAGRVKTARERVARLRGRDDLPAAVDAFWQVFEVLSEGTGFRGGESPSLSLRFKDI
jgi:hypothetical protein